MASSCQIGPFPREGRSSSCSALKGVECKSMHKRSTMRGTMITTKFIVFHPHRLTMFKFSHTTACIILAIFSSVKGSFIKQALADHYKDMEHDESHETHKHDVHYDLNSLLKLENDADLNRLILKGHVVVIDSRNDQFVTMPKNEARRQGIYFRSRDDGIVALPEDQPEIMRGETPRGNHYWLDFDSEQHAGEGYQRSACGNFIYVPCTERMDKLISDSKKNSKIQVQKVKTCSWCSCLKDCVTKCVTYCLSDAKDKVQDKNDECNRAEQDNTDRAPNKPEKGEAKEDSKTLERFRRLRRRLQFY